MFTQMMVEVVSTSAVSCEVFGLRTMRTGGGARLDIEETETWSKSCYWVPSLLGCVQCCLGLIKTEEHLKISRLHSFCGSCSRSDELRRSFDNTGSRPREGSRTTPRPGPPSVIRYS